MSGHAHSVALVGVDGRIVDVEAAVGGGLPRTVLVGLPDASLYEARDRCRAAVVGSKLAWPDHLLTINLSPATLPKSGSHYDLAIIAAVWRSEGHVPPRLRERTVMLGEVGLGGRVRPVLGLLPALIAAAEAGFSAAIVPADQLREAALVKGVKLYGVGSLEEFQQVLRGAAGAQVPAGEKGATVETGRVPDFAEVIGQPEARWAMEVAAAGRHHISLSGPPGVGKTMLASRLPSILPPLSDREALEVSAVHSLAGMPVEGLVHTPPFADPHHGASAVAMIGGGSRVIRPGAISLAHRGVLFLDEAPEFSPKVLESLRTPLESGEVLIARSGMRARFPARFQLVLASNPCPCGNWGSTTQHCRCQPYTVRRYQERVSGPILDRIDIHQNLRQQHRSVSRLVELGECSASIADRVREARARQARRLRDTPWSTNAEVSGAGLRQLPIPAGMEMLDRALRRNQLTARGIDKVWRLAWSVADLSGRDRVSADHLATALAMRQEKGEAA